MKCKTCKFWVVYEENEMLGMCTGLGVMKAGFVPSDPVSVCITFMKPDSLACNTPISDYIVRTDADYGCVVWRQKDQLDKETENGK